MSKFQEFCYLVVQRNRANAKRKRLLYKVRKAWKQAEGHHYHYHIRDEQIKEERTAYRNHADEMKRIAKQAYSPMRRELGIICTYDGNNKVYKLIYQGESYNIKQIENMANAYIFESILLTDEPVNTVYAELIN